jgi:hypothetical protein
MKKSDQKTYLPFHAVNEYMREDFRLQVIHEVFTNLESCNPEFRSRLGKMVSKKIQVPGFRNSNQAPTNFKIKNSLGIFEKSAEFAALVMECWSQIHSDLRKKTHAILVENGWKIPALPEDRTLQTGFQLDWPKEHKFEFFCQQIREKHPDTQESDDEISLMVVWTGNRLPFNLYAEAEDSDQSVNSNS